MITKNGKKKTLTHKANLGLNYVSAVFFLAERDSIGSVPTAGTSDLQNREKYLGLQGTVSTALHGSRR